MIEKCIFCGGKKEIFLAAEDRLNPGEKYIYRKCRNCDLITLDERKDNKEFYAYNQYKKPSRAQIFSFWLMLKRIGKFKKKGKVLDFGCGAGNLAKYLSGKGYEVDCLDVNEESIEWVKKTHRLPITKKIQNKKYDIIILDNVFEHLPNPGKELKIIGKHVKNGGIIFMAIPNINSWQARIFGKDWFHLDAPRHLNHFYGKSFESMLKKENLKVIKKFYFNINIDPIGWYWSLRKPKYDARRQAGSSPLMITLGLFLPLVLISSLFRATGLVSYVIERE